MHFDLNKILFFDVETVSQYKELSDLSVEDRKLWDFYYDTFKERVTDKNRLPKVDSSEEIYKEEVYKQTSSLFPEFAKVCCISVAFVTKDGEVKINSFYGVNEYEILDKARDIFNKVHGLGFQLCGQNIKNFDIPFLGKRYLINGLNPPNSFPSYNTKPWEMPLIDTKEIWSFSNPRGLSSLDLICSRLGIDSPKTGDVKGDNVYKNYWLKKYEEIKDYCQKDVQSLVNIISKLNNLK